jgi:hypothetical protein
MIKITGINRKIATEQVGNTDQTESGLGLVLSNHTCNAVFATDEFFNKGHFSLTEAEGREFDELCQRVEQRIVSDIGDYQRGAEALQPPKPQEEASKVAAATA